MSPILILIIVFSLVVVVAGAVMLGRPSKGELLEGPPEGTLPREAGSQPEDPNSLAGPEIEIVEPVAGILGTGIAITGPELTPEEEAANIAAAEQADRRAKMPDSLEPQPKRRRMSAQIFVSASRRRALRFPGSSGQFFLAQRLTPRVGMNSKRLSFEQTWESDPPRVCLVLSDSR